MRKRRDWMLSVLILDMVIKLQPIVVWGIFGVVQQQKGKFCSGWRLQPPSHSGSGCAQQSVPSGSLKTADPGGNVTAAVGGCLMLLIVLLRAVPHSQSDSRLREAPQLYSLHI